MQGDQRIEDDDIELELVDGMADALLEGLVEDDDRAGFTLGGEAFELQIVN
jgi:hypothetical protein